MPEKGISLLTVSDPEIGTLMWEPPESLIQSMSNSQQEMLEEMFQGTLLCFMHLFVGFSCSFPLFILFGPRLHDELMKLGDEATKYLEENLLM